METEDFKDSSGLTVDRLTAVKQVLDEFLARRKGDRVGLIFFGSTAFVQAPFTEDLKVVRTLMDEAQVRMAGPQTMMGDAIGLALHVFESSEMQERVLIVLTDGNDTGSQVPPEKASEIARDKEIMIHTVAIGDPKSVGEEKLDAETLKTMSKITGGGYYHGMNRKELEDIYDKLDALETRQVETISHRPKRDLFFWPLSVFFGLGLLFHTIALIQNRRVIATNNR
jgi:Ca-activated chloride channel family protein